MSGFQPGSDGFEPRKILIARKEGDCVNCSDGIKLGERIMRNYGGWCHLWCMPRWKYAFAQQALRRWGR